MMSGIPVPPCNTIGTLVTSFISFILSKLILGSFIYKPSSRVYGEVTFKYHLLFNNVKSNSSTIKFYVRSVVSTYTINCYELNTNKLLTTYTKKALVNDEITEMYPKIKSYSIVSNRELTKKINIKKEENIYNFYYEKVPKTGLNFLFN